MFRALTIALFLAPTSLFAEGECEDLWFSRNAIYDAYGYCFGSVLGKSMFSNDGCTTVDPQLPQDLQNRVDAIWDKARALKCAVDQTKVDIALYNKESRYLLDAQPIAETRQKACIGAQLEAPISLLTSPANGAEPLGEVQQGDSIAYFHKPEGDWEFVTILTTSNGRPASSGWTDAPMPECNKAIE